MNYYVKTLVPLIWECKDTSFSRDTKIYFVFFAKNMLFFYSKCLIFKYLM